MIASGTAPSRLAVTSAAYSTGTGARKRASQNTGQPQVLEPAAPGPDGATKYLTGSTATSAGADPQAEALTVAVSVAAGQQIWSTVIVPTASTKTGGLSAIVIGGEVCTLAQDWVPSRRP